jgi:hypothetical protein
MILQCPRCLRVLEWERARKPEGPGECSCGSRLWDVCTGEPRTHVRVYVKPPRSRGYVIVMSSKGLQELRAPNWQENPNGWVPVNL